MKKMKLSLKSLISAMVCIVGFTVSSLQAQSLWKLSAFESGFQEIQIDQKDTLLGVECSTHLKLFCTQDSKGATGFTGMELTVFPCSTVTGFNFDNYEGPEAPASSKKLLRITLNKETEPVVFEMKPNGWRSAEIQDGFVFGVGTPTNKKNGAMRKVIETIINGAKTIEISITDLIDSSKVLVATFPVEESRQDFEELIKRRN